MTEITSTRSNHLIDPSFHAWGWEIPVYLFLGGLVAGMMVITGYFFLSGRYKNLRSSVYVLPSLGLGLLSLGMLALFLDLEHKLYTWRLYTTFEPLSPMSWGAAGSSCSSTRRCSLRWCCSPGPPVATPAEAGRALRHPGGAPDVDQVGRVPQHVPRGPARRLRRRPPLVARRPAAVEQRAARSPLPDLGALGLGRLRPPDRRRRLRARAAGQGRQRLPDRRVDLPGALPGRAADVDRRAAGCRPARRRAVGRSSGWS